MFFWVGGGGGGEGGGQGHTQEYHDPQHTGALHPGMLGVAFGLSSLSVQDGCCRMLRDPHMITSVCEVSGPRKGRTQIRRPTSDSSLVGLVASLRFLGT